jgi:outer membrane protein assembly factor BamA
MRLAARFLFVTLTVISLAGAATEQKIESVRIHGNHTMPDDEVLQIAAIASGGAFNDSTVEQIKTRLMRSKRFESVEVRVRYRSLDESGDVALILLVRERRRLEKQWMVGPIFKLSDEYGLTIGAKFAFVDVLREGGRISFPLSWGGERRIGVEADFPIAERDRGKIKNRVSFKLDRYRTNNPHYDTPDNRLDAGAGVVSRFRWLSASFRGDWTDVSFADLDESFWTTKAGVAFDTRIDATVPGDAVYLGFEWRRYFFQATPDRQDVNRLAIDLRGYKRLIGQLLLATQLYHSPADGPLPPYEKPFLGGGQTLRGYERGQYIGDNITLAAVELRLPLTSPLSFGRVGIHLFFDTGTVYDYGQKLSDAKFYQGVGFGGFFRVAIIGVRADLGFDLEGNIRFHIGSGFRF